MAGHSGQQHMYDTLSGAYYWQHWANDVYITIAECKSCVQNGSLHRHKRPFQLFPTSKPLEFIALDIINPLSEKNQSSQYIFFTTDHYLKLTRAILLFKTLFTHVADVLLDHWMLLFGNLTYLLTDNGSQFVSGFFKHVCRYLGVKNLLTTANNPQINGQSKQFNWTIFERLLHYVANHQRDWVLYVLFLTHAYNTQVHRSAETSPYSLVVSHHSPGQSLRHASSSTTDTLTSSNPH